MIIRCNHKLHYLEFCVKLITSDTYPKIQIENEQLLLLFLLVPLSFATYFPFGQIIAAMSLITLGLWLVNLKGSLDKHLYIYTKDIYLLSFMTALAVDLLMPVKANGSNF